jgi:ferredoxin
MIEVTSRNEHRTIAVFGTILESLEKSNVPIESHCRDGFCGACRIKLKSGEVEEVIDPLAFLHDDEVLACCMRPKTKIEIEVL